MGNFSSCTAGFDSVSPSSQLVARVLLIDGSMLKFRAPIKVIKLLLDYPNHLICPLDSLTPGLHSLSSLLPDEKLQLGRLYLLLPFKSNMQESCIKGKRVMQQKMKDQINKEPSDERTRLLPGSENSDVGFPNCANFYKKGVDVGVHDNCKLQSSSLEVVQEEHKKDAKCSTGQQKNHVNVMKSEVGVRDSAELRRDCDAGLQCSRRRGAATTGGSYGKLAEKRRGRREMLRHKSNMLMKEGQCKANGISPLCDTPELQKAYRSFLLRRSCSWTPRLQPILERR